MNIKLFLTISKSGFKNYEIVTVEVGFEVKSLCERGHFASSEVDSALNFTGAIAEFEHIGVVLSVDFFESGYDRDGVEFLVVESGIVFEIVIDLVDGEGNNGLVVDWLVFLFCRVHYEFECFPLFDLYYKLANRFKEQS